MGAAPAGQRGAGGNGARTPEAAWEGAAKDAASGRREAVAELRRVLAAIAARKAELRAAAACVDV